MRNLLVRILRRLRRIHEGLFFRKRFIVYSAELKSTLGPTVAAKEPIEFHINSSEAFAVLQLRGQEYEIDESIEARINKQLEDGETCVSGWVRGELAYIGWVQFEHRLLTRRNRLPLPAGTACIYRCFTRADFRGKHIYPAAISFTCRWLLDRGYQRVLIDHQIENFASGAGILRAGMRPVAEYQIIQIFWFRFALPDEALIRITSTVLSQ